MLDKNELCERIVALYPDIGACGIDIDVHFNEIQNAWVVDLKKEGHELKHFLEPTDADACMQGKQCVSLGLEIAQMINNINGEQF